MTRISKIIQHISIGLLLLMACSCISIDRSNEKLEKIAKSIFLQRQHDFKETDKWDDFEMLPYVDNKTRDGLIFTWIYKIYTGDTAKISLELLKSKSIFDAEGSLILNDKFSYIFETEKDLINLLPQKYKHDKDYINKMTLISLSDFQLDSLSVSSLKITSARLFDYLERGYYDVLARYNDNTVVAFYEAIAEMRTDTKDTEILTARIVFKENSNVLIIPYQASHNEWQNYNKE